MIALERMLAVIGVLAHKGVFALEGVVVLAGVLVSEGVVVLAGVVLPWSGAFGSFFASLSGVFVFLFFFCLLLLKGCLSS